MKFRLIQKKTKGWNLMFGKTFIRSFHFVDKEEAFFFLDKINETIKDIDASCHFTKELIKNGRWIKPPKDCYLPNLR